MKFVLCRTSSTYQHGISKYEKMYNHVLPCTVMYCHVLLKVRSRTYSYVLLVICLYQYVPICTGMYSYAKNYQKYVPERTP